MATTTSAGGMPHNQGGQSFGETAQLFPFTNPGPAGNGKMLVIDRGEGIYVFDTDGRKYLEAMSGLWCAGLGFSDGKVIQAITDQLRRLPYYHNFMGKAAEPGVRLAERLAALAPGDLNHVFFGTSGSDAIDTAAKLVWAYHNGIGKPQKKRLIARADAYHGSGILSASLTGMSMCHDGFDLPLPMVLRTASPHFHAHADPGESEIAFSRRRARDLEDLIKREDPGTIGGFFGEPVIGSGGVMIPPEGYWEEIQNVLSKYAILLVADEVICGFGRTGNMFGSETFAMRPDMMTLAKQLTAAYLPLSAVIMRDHVHDAIAAQSEKLGLFGHGFTYSGHPVSCAAALAVLDRYEELRIVERVRERARVLASALDGILNHPAVGDVRSVGLMGAVEFDRGWANANGHADRLGILGKEVVEEAQERGVIFRPLGDIVGICPPMIIDGNELNAAMAVLKDSIEAVYGA